MKKFLMTAFAALFMTAANADQILLSTDSAGAICEAGKELEKTDAPTKKKSPKNVKPVNYVSS